MRFRGGREAWGEGGWFSWGGRVVCGSSGDFRWIGGGCVEKAEGASAGMGKKGM